MEITLNGEKTELPGPLTVSALLERLAIDPRVVAVELNGRVVKRLHQAERIVTEGAEVEIVAFVGGGED